MTTAMATGEVWDGARLSAVPPPHPPRMGAGVLPQGYGGVHQDARGGYLFIIPLHPMVYTDREADE